MKRMRGGSVYTHKFITDENGMPIPNSNIVQIVNKTNENDVRYGQYADNGIDGEHFIRIGTLDADGKLVTPTEKKNETKIL